MTDSLDVTLSPEEIRLLCDRLDRSAALAVLGLEAAMPVATERAEGRYAAPEVDQEAAKKALALLASPDLLIRMQRRDWKSDASATIAIGGPLAAEHRPLADGTRRLRLFPSDKALPRMMGFCGLLERPVHAVPGFRITPGQLVMAGELVGNGDPARAAAVLGASADFEDPKGIFLRALASLPAAAQVTVLRASGERRMEGTVTAWLDGGAAGLWRVPSIEVGRAGPGGRDQRVLHGTVVEVRPTSKAELVEEITEGVPQLRAR